MPRVKRGVIHLKKRRRILKTTKGYKHGKKKLIKQAIEASHKAGAHAFADRKKKKRNNRALWQIRLSAALKKHDLSYSKFINILKINKVELDRKVLSELAVKHEKVFDAIVKSLKK